jgi:hypothetical protein
MMLPPAILRLRVVENKRRKIALWLPIFLLWPPLFLLIVASLPLILVLALAFWWHTKARKVVKSIVPVFDAICSLRGLTVDVESEEEKVLIKIT